MKTSKRAILNSFQFPILRNRLKFLYFASLTAVVSLTIKCGSSWAQVSPTLSASPAPVGIQPMTQVTINPPSGYFPDPLPIHFASGVSAPQSLSGTNKAVLSCQSSIQAKCFTLKPITIDLGSLPQQASASGSTITNISNNNIYQDNKGTWQMATTLYLSNPSLSGDTTWTVIAHAHATNTTSAVPTAWAVDTLLIGSLTQSAKANYDGKYFEDGGKLYLLYSKEVQSSPLHDGVVAQLMQSATQLAASAPIILLEPDDTNGGFNSEYFFGLNPPAPFKLVETGNITKINGKYALAYSTGAFNTPGYKAGIAWSDTFLPPPRAFYKKVLKQDTTGVWGQPNHLDVVYLLQSQQSAWPNYIASQVLAPGVPSIVYQSGNYYLYFAGFDPSDAPLVTGTPNFEPSHRRPYFVRLQLAIPASATVAATSNMNLANWMTTVMR